MACRDEWSDRKIEGLVWGIQRVGTRRVHTPLGPIGQKRGKEKKKGRIEDEDEDEMRNQRIFISVIVLSKEAALGLRSMLNTHGCDDGKQGSNRGHGLG